jgi:hypothetical protein
MALRWRAPKAVHMVDRRSVVNPAQARALLAAVAEHSTGPRLVAFFGCFTSPGCARRKRSRCGRRTWPSRRSAGGEIHLDGAEPHAGKERTDSGGDRDRRQLKQRAAGEGRTVPCPPELTALLRPHRTEFGTGAGRAAVRRCRNQNELPWQVIDEQRLSLAGLLEQLSDEEWRHAVGRHRHPGQRVGIARRSK